MRKTSRCLVLLFFFLPAFEALGEEGHYPYFLPPLADLEKTYGFRPDQAFLDRLRLSSVQIDEGASGSFISPHGLILTNHHVAYPLIAQVSTAQANYAEDGYFGDEDLKTDGRARVLLEMKDVTGRMLKAAGPGLSPAAAEKARNREKVAIEKECLKAGGPCEVVSFYQDSVYYLYRYKEYRDIRLVFAPEADVAYFGGEYDNFVYPRHDLDCALLRAYEDGEPAQTPAFLPVTVAPLAEGELVFVSGFPRETGRWNTVAQHAFTRDIELPREIEKSRTALERYQAYAARGEEQARQAAIPIFYAGNSLKREEGGLKGLNDPEVFARLEKQEARLREAVAASPELSKQHGDGWDLVAGAQEAYGKLFDEEMYANLGDYTAGDAAIRLVRYATEIEKPEAERLDEYRESRLEEARRRILTANPFFPELEKIRLDLALSQALSKLGAGHPFVAAALEGRTVEDVAASTIASSRLLDREVRAALLQGGRKAVLSSDDPLVRLAVRVNPVMLRIEQQVRDEVEAVRTQGGIKTALARFAVLGESQPPDANSTLRLSYGTTRRYELGTTLVPFRTTFFGLFDRALAFDNAHPFRVPDRYLAKRGALDLATPLNVVTTADIVGGNSGSPLVNRKGELVGAVFDGNIESLVWYYAYTDRRGRAVAVTSQGILEALSAIYGKQKLVEEMLPAGRKR